MNYYCDYAEFSNIVFFLKKTPHLTTGIPVAIQSDQSQCCMNSRTWDHQTKIHLFTIRVWNCQC